VADKVVQVQVDVVAGDTSGIDQAKQKAAEAARAGQQAALRPLPVPAPTAAPAAPAVQRAVAQPGGASDVVASGVQTAQRLVQAAGGGIHALAGSLGQFVPVAGLAVAAGGLLAGAVEALRAAFGRFQPTLAETQATLAQATNALQQGRQGGRTTAEQFRAAFTQRPEVVTELVQAQNRGDRAGQEALLRRVQQEAQQQQAGIETRNPEQIGAEVGQQLTRIMEETRAGGGRRAAAGAAAVELNRRDTLRQAWLRAGNRIEDMPDVLRSIDPSALNPELIQQVVGQFGTRLVGARAQAESAGNLLRPGGMVSLRPGAPTEPEGLFQRRTGDVLTLGDVIQQDLVRDQREEQRFLRTVQLWEEYRDELRRIGQPVVT
jgi:hypothetical protein